MTNVTNVLQISVCLFRKEREISGLFLEITDEWSELETLQHIIKFVTDLCVAGLTVEQGNYLLLHEALRFFEMVRTLKYEITDYFHLQKKKQLSKTEYIYCTRVHRILKLRLFVSRDMLLYLADSVSSQSICIVNHVTFRYMQE